jgi:hypothetical protein
MHGKTTIKIPLTNQGVDQRDVLKESVEFEGINWTHMAQNRFQWRAFASKLMKYFLTEVLPHSQFHPCCQFCGFCINY